VGDLVNTFGVNKQNNTDVLLWRPKSDCMALAGAQAYRFHGALWTSFASVTIKLFGSRKRLKNRTKIF
jgi:hypothetical protein